jgi:hypothetical protein
VYQAPVGLLVLVNLHVCHFVGVTTSSQSHASHGSDTEGDTDFNSDNEDHNSPANFTPVTNEFYVLSFNSPGTDTNNSKYRYRYYVGQVIEDESRSTSSDDYSIKFMRYSRTSTPFQFGWPVAVDEAIMSRSDFVIHLSRPKSGRRGTLVFDGSEIGPFMKWMQ